MFRVNSTIIVVSLVKKRLSTSIGKSFTDFYKRIFTMKKVFAYYYLDRDSTPILQTV